MRERLQKTLEELKAGLQQAQANVHANQGAIQIVEKLIKELDDEENADVKAGE